MPPNYDGCMQALFAARERRGVGAAVQKPAQSRPRFSRCALQPAATRRGRVRRREGRQPSGHLAAANLFGHTMHETPCVSYLLSC
jgi:hypothetical protein